MTKVTIVGAPQSPLVWATRMAAVEKGVDAELAFALPHTPEIMAIQPFGKMPAMRHGDFQLGESRAIVLYIDGLSTANPLKPQDLKAAAIAEQWTMHFFTEAVPVMLGRYVGQYFFPKIPGAPDRTVIDAALAPMEKIISVINGQLEKQDYLAGLFTVADIFFGPLLHYVGLFPEGARMIAAHPRVSAYFARLQARDAFKATFPPPMPAKAA